MAEPILKVNPKNDTVKPQSRHQVLAVLDGKVQSKEIVKPRDFSIPFSEHQVIPQFEGYYMLYSSQGAQPVQVINKNDAFAYRCFDGSISTSLPPGGFIVGPITDVNSDLKNYSPTQIKEPDSVISLENELNSVYGLVERLEREIGVLNKQLSESQADSRIAALKKHNTELLEKIDLVNQRASVSEEELETTRSESKDFARKLEKAQQEITLLNTQLKSAVSSSADSKASLSKDVIEALSVIRLLLIQSSLVATGNESRELLKRLVEQIKI